jgi:hypothetical protein
MQISITAVSKNRTFTKALVRHALTIAPLKSVADDIDTSDIAFDILQLVFVDNSENQFRTCDNNARRLGESATGTWNWAFGYI